jgi:hypothetical protein
MDGRLMIPLIREIEDIIGDQSGRLQQMNRRSQL